MLLDDAQKRRQLMMKGSSRPTTLKENAIIDDGRSASLLTSLEVQNCPTTFVAHNSANGNPIIAVFPRIPIDEESKESTSGSS